MKKLTCEDLGLVIGGGVNTHNGTDSDPAGSLFTQEGGNLDANLTDPQGRNGQVGSGPLTLDENDALAQTGEGDTLA